MKRTRRQLRPVMAAKGTADVYLDGVIGEDVMAADIREQLALAKGAPVNVHINSEGGSVTEGMAIYSALRSYAGKKTGIVEGIAASMASLVLMACDERRVTKGAFVMIHSPSGGAKGTADELAHAAELLGKIRSEMLDIYESATGMLRAELEKLVDYETYFTAEEAVASGFADSVTGDDARIQLDAVARLNPKKLPEALRALAQKESPMAKMSDEDIKSLEEKCKALEEENAKLKAEAGDDDEGEEPKHDTHAEDGDDDGEEEEPASEGDDDEKKEARALARDVLRLTGAKSFGEARGKVMALAHKAGASVRDSRASAVSKLITDGKLMPAQKSWAMKASDKAFGAYVREVGSAQIAPVGRAHKEPAETATLPAKPSANESKMGRMLGLSQDQIIQARSAEPKFGVIKKDAN